MRVFKKICALVFLLAAVGSLGFLGGLIHPATTGRFTELMGRLPLRVALVVCMALTALGVVTVVLRTLFQRRPISVVRLQGRSDIEVATDAVSSVARIAAEEAGVMVESVRCRAAAADVAGVRVEIEAIAFVDQGLSQLADRVQDAVRRACETLLGTSDVTVRVRFLPSKTTVIQGGTS